MMKRVSRPSASAKNEDVDYTVPSLIALVGVVLLTALFFAQPNVAENANFSGKAYADAGTSEEESAEAQAPSVCEASAYCEGSRLVRQGSDCREYIAYCTYGCVYDAKGFAVCAS
jgi:hypothetical protein